MCGFFCVDNKVSQVVLHEINRFMKWRSGLWPLWFKCLFFFFFFSTISSSLTLNVLRTRRGKCSQSRSAITCLFEWRFVSTRYTGLFLKKKKNRSVVAAEIVVRLEYKSRAELTTVRWCPKKNLFVLKEEMSSLNVIFRHETHGYHWIQCHPTI